ncbi:reprolysin-like metallopeptidase [Aliikangiella sp. IMCC44359]|uniref:reprolysin-like metallopeptidase n=1 Tax=Aliikangiella sp. IMCC44359 TaxID=3459125 RepID=UPI00403B23ED
MKQSCKIFFSICVSSLSLSASSQALSFWQVPSQPKAIYKPENSSKQYVGEKHYRLDISGLEQQLLIVNSNSLSQPQDADKIVTIPLPNGKTVRFSLTPSSIMENALAKKYPSIKTYVGTQIDNPNHQGRFDITPHGFHAMFNYQEQRIFIDPIHLGDRESYRVYDSNKAIDLQGGFKENVEALETQQLSKKTHANQKVDFGTELRTYRIAVSAAGEYTAFHGGTKELGLAAITTAINRINLVYNKDVAVNLILVANNDQIIYTDASSDPFANDASGDISTNQTVIDNNIGSANYDIGHIFNTGGGGLAGLGVVCGTRKAQGVTGSGNPTGDSFNIDYVAHEVGHQFGGYHTFNGSASSCSGNRSGSAAFEPGSGSTIMAYAGICGSQNVQNFSNDYFHGYSIEQFRNFITNGSGASCGSLSPLNNQVPTANAGNDVTIPAQTPFQLTGSANDADAGDTANLTYIWEQRDLGPTTSSPGGMIDDGQRPLFRSYEPTTSPTRIFPKLSTIVAGKSSVFEVLPTTNREMNFQLTVRDGRGGVAQDMAKVTVDNSAGPFVVTEPSTNINATGSMTTNVTWNVANTDTGTVNCSLVNVAVSVDGGVNFETMLSNTANDGQADVTMPNVDTVQARVKVECSDERFFNISPTNFSITQSGVPSITGQQTLSTDEEQNLTITLADLIVNDIDNNYPQDFTLNVIDGDNYTVSGATITPDEDFNGDLSVRVTVNDGEFDSPEAAIIVTVNPVNDAPIISDANNSLDFDEDTSFELPISVVSVTDVDSNSFTLQIADGENYSFNGTEITPSANFEGTLNINLTVSDGELNSNQLSISINITSINDAPEANNDTLSVAQDSSNNSLSVLNNDTDVDIGDQLTINSVNYTGSGALSIATGGGSLNYAPKAGFSGQESFTYTIQDSDGLQATASVTINVTQTAKSGGGSLFYNLILILTLIGLRKCQPKKK